MVPPDLADYLAAIDRGFAEMMVHETTELWCEPGRALVAEGSSLLTRVELRKGDALYLNDGAYGSLFDAAHAKWPFPVKLVRGEGARDAELGPFRFFGPTCDSADHMPGPFWLPEDVREGDYVEIGMLGAYGVAMATPLQRLWRRRDGAVNDAPMASMFGLAPLSAPPRDSGGRSRQWLSPKGASAGRKPAPFTITQKLGQRRPVAPTVAPERRAITPKGTNER